ncbi:MAG: cytochrome c biogenesis protein CcsA [Candidatus Kariarchaeaceae archaeon]|jgi:cytochrome c-type biogenesis protein CcmF
MNIIFGIVGNYSLYVAVLLTWIVFVITWKQKKRRQNLQERILTINIIASILLWTSFIILVIAFIDKEYRYVTVYSYSDNTMSLSERIMATWASRQGVMILWSAFLTSIATGVFWYLQNDIEHPIVSRALTITFFFSALIATFSISSRPGPFELGPMYEDGLGLSPPLLSIWQEIHPPVAFLAYATFMVPYAGGLAILSLKKENVPVPPKLNWLNDFFMMFGWGLTGIFMLAGSIWGYEENWAGFWAWDPVEIATLILWLVSTLYFHAKTLVPRNHPLISVSAALGWVSVTFASFVVRGGLLQGFHSYAGAAKAIVFGLLFIGSAIGLVYPIRKLKERIIPERLYAFREHSSKVKLTTFWLLVSGISINVVGLFSQMGNALITHKTILDFNGSKRIKPSKNVYISTISFCQFIISYRICDFV